MGLVKGNLGLIYLLHMRPFIFCILVHVMFSVLVTIFFYCTDYSIRTVNTVNIALVWPLQVRGLSEK